MHFICISYKTSINRFRRSEARIAHAFPRSFQAPIFAFTEKEEKRNEEKEEKKVTGPPVRDKGGPEIFSTATNNLLFRLAASLRVQRSSRVQGASFRALHG